MSLSLEPVPEPGAYEEGSNGASSLDDLLEIHDQVVGLQRQHTSRETHIAQHDSVGPTMRDIQDRSRCRLELPGDIRHLCMIRLERDSLTHVLMLENIFVRD